MRENQGLPPASGCSAPQGTGAGPGRKRFWLKLFRQHHQLGSAGELVVQLDHGCTALTGSTQLQPPAEASGGKPEPQGPDVDPMGRRPGGAARQPAQQN